MSDITFARIGLEQTLSLAQSALPDAPVQPDKPASSIVSNLRLRVAGVRRRLSASPAAVPGDSQVATGRQGA